MIDKTNLFLEYLLQRLKKYGCQGKKLNLKKFGCQGGKLKFKEIWLPWMKLEV